ncbi:MAG: AI-2E family transporter, partial [Bacilli bacterium]
MNDLNKPKKSWVWQWFLNNKMTSILFSMLLLFLVILVFSKIAFILNPVLAFITTVALPIILAGILYYLLNPIIDYFEKKGIKRIYSIIGVFILIIALLVSLIIIIIPTLETQISSFISNIPNYIATLERKSEELFQNPLFGQFQPELESFFNNFTNSIDDFIKSISKSTIFALGNVFNTITTIVVALLTMPFILFYMLKDGKQIVPYFIKFLPTKIQKPTYDIMKEVSSQVSSYIIGQLIVALAVAFMFSIGLSIIGLEYAITLGIIAGLMNMIPYLGSFLAMIPIVFLAIVAGPVMLVKVIIVFVIEQTI